MAQRYRLTARRRAALKKAQLASARKRSRKSKVKRAAIVGGVGAGVLGVAVARHKLSGSGFVVSGERTVLRGQRIKTTRGPRIRNKDGSPVKGLKGKKRYEKPVRSVVADPTRSRILGSAGGYNHKSSSGVRSIGYKHRTRKRDTTVGYVHRPLRGADVSRAAKTVLGTKITSNPRAISTGRRLAFATRGIRRKGNVYAPQYRPQSAFNYGSYGKRLPTVGMVKYRGGKKVT